MRCGQSLLRRLTVLAVAFPLWVSCAEGTKAQFIVAHVNVIPMTGENVILPDRDVVICDGRISAIRDSEPTDKTSQETVNGRGKWLIPGLTDGHMHVWDIAYTGVGTSDVYLPYLANGVLQVVNLQALPKGIEQRTELSTGKAVGPQLIVARMIDGSPPTWSDSIVATTPEEGRASVRRIQAEGYDLVKVYMRLNLETFNAIIAEARLRNIKVVGHLPLRNRAMTEQLLQPGFGMVAHAEEYFYQGPDRTDATIVRFAALAKRNGTDLITTLTANEQIVAQARNFPALQARPELVYLPPLLRREWLENNRYVRFANPDGVAVLGSIVDFNKRLVRAFAAGGVMLVAGTDSLIPGVVPGFALHDELEALVDAGLTNWWALAAATIAPARWLGTDSDRGTVEAGKVADLVLLDTNPLDHIANTRRIAAVILHGQLLSKAELDRKMALLAARFAGGTRP
jgi:imidazolonepropionase-like amidohydrolase